MTLLIREYGKKDETEVQALLKRCSEEPYVFNILLSPALKRAYIALLNKKVIGIIFTWHSSFHPYCTYLKLLIHPEFEFERVAESLLLEINSQVGLKQPLQTLVGEDANDYREFYENNGFVEIRKTYLPLFPTKKQQVLELSCSEHTIKSLSEVHQDEDIMRDLAQLVKRNYEETHLDNPVAETPLEKWEQLILAEDIIIDGSLLYVDNTTQKILAYSLLHESEEDDWLELGWCGSETDLHLKLISKLVSVQINYGLERGYLSILGECDTTSKYVMEVFRSMGAPECKTLMTYQSVTC